MNIGTKLVVITNFTNCRERIFPWVSLNRPQYSLALENIVSIDYLREYSSKASMRCPICFISLSIPLSLMDMLYRSTRPVSISLRIAAIVVLKLSIETFNGEIIMTLKTKPMKLPTNTSMPHIKEIIVNSSIDCLSY